MAALRQSEQRAAAAAVGVSDVRFLGYPDGRVQPTIELRRDISRVIRDVKPSVAPRPVARTTVGLHFASHPDHLATGEAAVCAVYPDARNHLPTPSYSTTRASSPGPSTKMWIMGGDNSNVAVDTTSTIERKIAALLCHKSQIDDPDGIAERITLGGLAQGQAAGFAEGASVEMFRVTHIP